MSFKSGKTVKPVDKGFAVIELFTSEGCSSCPPADALVAKVQKESSDKPVYILAYHVDYWNRMGWKDAFSDAAYSDRQRQYARWLKLGSLYTPQVIANGVKEFVGSEEATLRNAIKTDLQKPAKAELSLTNLRENRGKANLQYHVEGVTNNSSLVVTLIEKNATTKVLKGENGGRTLSHVQIVRKLQNVLLNNHNSGDVSIELPAGFSPDGFEVIGFVQNNSNGEIMGAARSEFSAAVIKAK
ncbi:MAG: DUF1223 domain-containing protein [Mucilaginibacter sp.]